MEQKRLIITADDFGLCKEVNKAILNCYKKGMVKNASILANSEEFQEAVDIARKERMGIGAHLNLTQGKALTKMKNLTDKENNFKNNLYVLFLKSFSQKIRKKIEKEFREQILKIKKQEINPIYLDSHRDIHAFPLIFKEVVKLAKEYNLKVRLPSSKRKSPFWKKILRKIFFKINSKILDKNNFDYPKDFICISGFSKDKIFKFIDKFENTCELSSHPSYYDKNLRNFTNLIKEREEDRKILLDKELKKFIYKKNIKLISYDEI